MSGEIFDTLKREFMLISSRAESEILPLRELLRLAVLRANYGGDVLRHG